MVKIDLITGFLGSGKTTFIKKYAQYLMSQGFHIGILENDYGAVNVDMMLLQDLMGEQCELEMISGGCDKETHIRRFRTKLISMGMCGYDRVIVEPSGIFDVDEFFDVLHEEPLDNWYEIGNVIAVVDAELENELSAEADYLLASEAANAGKILLSHADEADGALYFMNSTMSEETLKAAVKKLFEDENCGNIFRIKGFLKADNDMWLELNATHSKITLQPIAEGQDVLIVIGERLNKEAVESYIQSDSFRM